MKILIFSQHFWPESFRINDVARSLRDAGHEVSVLTGQPNYPGGTVFDGYRAMSCGMETVDGIDIHRVPLVPRGPGSAWRLVANYLSFALSSAAFGAWRLRGREIDVIFVYASSPLLQALGAIALARLKGCALATWVQDLWPQSLEATGYVRNPRLLAGVSKVVRWIYARQDLLLVQSEGFVAPVRHLAAEGVPIRVHPNPGERQRAGTGPAALVLPGRFNVVFAGNLGTAQALDSVLEAAERLRSQTAIHFTLIGSGQRSAWLAEQVHARGLTNLSLPGRYAPEAMPAILAQAQLLLVTLVADPAMALTVPSKIQTYLAAGKPIIAALAGEGARVVIEAGAGLACPPADGSALASAVLALAALPQAARESMGQSGQRYYRHRYAPDHLTPILVQHLKDAVLRSQKRRATGRRQ